MLPLLANPVAAVEHRALQSRTNQREDLAASKNQRPLVLMSRNDILMNDRVDCEPSSPALSGSELSAQKLLPRNSGAAHCGPLLSPLDTFYLPLKRHR
jgi:hypothetical protein